MLLPIDVSHYKNNKENASQSTATSSHPQSLSTHLRGATDADNPHRRLLSSRSPSLNSSTSAAQHLPFSPSPLAVQSSMAFLATAHYAWRPQNEPNSSAPAPHSLSQSLPSTARPKVSSNIAHLVNSTDEDDRFDRFGVGNASPFDHSSHNGPPLQLNTRMGTPSLEKTPSDVFMAWRKLDAAKEGRANSARSDWSQRERDGVYPENERFGPLKGSIVIDRPKIDTGRSGFHETPMESDRGSIERDHTDHFGRPLEMDMDRRRVDPSRVIETDHNISERDHTDHFGRPLEMDMDRRRVDPYRRIERDHNISFGRTVDRTFGRPSRPIIESRDHMSYGTDTHNAASSNSSSMHSHSPASSFPTIPRLRTDPPSWDIDISSSDVIHAWRSVHSDTQRLGQTPSPSSHTPSLSPTMSSSSQPTAVNRRPSSRQPDASKIHLNRLEIPEEVDSEKPVSASSCDQRPQRNKRGYGDGEGLFEFSAIDHRSCDAIELSSDDAHKSKRFCASKPTDEWTSLSDSTTSYPLDSSLASTESMVDLFTPVGDTTNTQSTFNPHFAPPTDRFRMGVDTPTDKYWDFPYLAHSSDIRRFILERQRQEQQQQQEQQRAPATTAQPEASRLAPRAHNNKYGRKLAYLRAIRPSVLPTAIGMATAAMNASMDHGCDVCGKVFKHPALLSTHRANHFEHEASSSSLLSSRDERAPDSGVSMSAETSELLSPMSKLPIHDAAHPVPHKRAQGAAAFPRRTSLTNKPTISPSPLLTQLVAKRDSSGSEGEGSSGRDGAVKAGGSQDDDDEEGEDPELMFSMVMMM
ncbi:hypothetical protein BJ742DRAFT_840012, partial [Cladochytrium replicatum]